MKNTEKTKRLINQIQDSNDEGENTMKKQTPALEKTSKKLKKTKKKQVVDKHLDEQLEYTAEMQRLDQVKRVMGLEDDDDDDDSDDNKKIIVKQKVTNEKKKNNKNTVLIIVLVLLIIIAVLSIFLAIYIQNNKKKVTSVEIKTITKEAYESIISDYGDAVTLTVKNYMVSNHQKLPTFDEIEESIYYPSHEVTCKKNIVNYDGSVYLSGCKIGDYDNVYRYEYGKKQEKIKTSENEIYVYQYEGENNSYYYVSSTLYDVENNQTLIDTYTCEMEDCIGYSSFSSLKEIIIYDGEYLFYNLETKEKTPIPSIGEEKYKAITPVVDKDGKLVALFLINQSGKGAYYITKKQQIITDFLYDSDSSDPLLISKGYFAANRLEKENMSIFIIHEITGEEIFEFTDAYSIYSEKVGDKSFYYATSSYFGERIGYYIKDTFEKLIPNKEKYFSVVNSDNTITIIDKQKFRVYNLEGELLFSSKKYSKLLKAVKDYVIVENNNEVQIVNLQGEKQATLLTKKDTYTYHPLISGLTKINEQEAIVFIVEDKEVEDGVEGRGLKYYYILETKEIGTLKTTGIGK